MCGIVGKVSLNNCQENDIINPLRALKHRGPDCQDHFCNKHVILGHARLSILDTEHGKQPMSFIYNNKKFTIVYNGETYNFKALRNELINFGIIFETNSDTEVVLKWLAFKGVAEGINALNGMFSIAFYNESDQEIFLIRDRMGIKPLYYTYQQNNLFFSSELDSIIKFHGIEKKINTEAVQQFFYFGYPITPNTMYKNIFELKPGTFLKYTLHDRKIEFNTYWTFDNSNPRNYTGSYEDGIDDLETILKECINDQIVSDVGYSTFLSGGIDSSLITSMVSTLREDEFNAYTVSFDDKEYDELPYAKKVAELYPNINHIVYDTKNFNLNTNFVDLILTHVGQPFADSSCIPTYLITQQVAKNEKVILSGDGGDELFMGYETFDWLNKINHSKLAPLFVRQLVLFLFQKLPMEIVIGEDFNRQANKALSYSMMDISALVLSLNSLLDIADLQKITNSKSFEWLENLKSELKKGTTNPYLLMQNFIMNVQLSGDMLRKVDSMSMANSVEVRVPFLDNRVIDFALSLPLDFLYRKGVKKSILKDVAKRYLPESVIMHKKWGFAIPMHKVLEKKFIDNHKYLFEKYHILNRDFIQKFHEEHTNKIYKNYSQYTIDHVNWMSILFYRWIEKNHVEIE